MKKASILSVIFASLITAALAPSGCSTGAADDLFAGSGDSVNAGSAAVSGSSGAQTSSSAGSSGSASGGGGGGGDPTTSSTSATSSTSGSSGSAGGADPETSASSVSSTSASTGGGPATVDCGGMPCEVGPEAACCWHNSQDPKTGDCTTGTAQTDDCSTSVQGGVFDSRIECQSQAQCPADTVCCGVRQNANGMTYYSSVTCQPTCTGQNVTLCDQLGEEGPDCPVVTAQGQQIQTVCKASALLPTGYLVCGQP